MGSEDLAKYIDLDLIPDQAIIPWFFFSSIAEADHISPFITIDQNRPMIRWIELCA